MYAYLFSFFKKMLHETRAQEEGEDTDRIEEQNKVESQLY